MKRYSLALLLALSALTFGAGSALAGGNAPGAVYAQTNDAAGNQVVAYSRAPGGTLTLLGRYDTGGLGTSRIRLSSQGSVVLSKNNRWLYVANVGSSEISVFAVRRNGLTLIDKVASGGQTPNSITVDEDLLYVLNNGGTGAGNITGFRIGDDGKLTQLPGSTRPLSGLGADPAQVSFTPDGESLIVTEKATNLIDIYSVDSDGYATGPALHASSGVTPFGSTSRATRLHRHRGLRRRHRRGRRVVVLTQRPGRLHDAQPVDPGLPQRGLLDGGDQGRQVRLHHELRRWHDLELLDRRRWQHLAARVDRDDDDVRAALDPGRGSEPGWSLPLRDRHHLAESARLERRPGRQPDIGRSVRRLAVDGRRHRGQLADRAGQTIRESPELWETLVRRHGSDRSVGGAR